MTKYEKIMRDALDSWAKSLAMQSHLYLAKILKPAFSAAYNAGQIDASRSRVKVENGVKAGFNKIKELADTIPVKSKK